LTAASSAPTGTTAPPVPYSQSGVFFPTQYLGTLFKDSGGFLHYQVSKVDVTPCIDAYADFASFCEGRGIDLLYVQAPNKELKGYTVLPEGAYNYANANADAFLAALGGKNLNYLDLREQIIAQNLDRESLFYKTDHHWKTPAAFWATSQTVKYLNSDFGAGLDADGSISDLSNYSQIEYKASFLGAQGRAVGAENAGLDDYTQILPDFPTSLAIWTSLHDGDPDRSGSFKQTIVIPELLAGDDPTVNRYASYFGADFPYLRIENYGAGNNYKIMLVKDSFGTPYGAFLSLYAWELDMVDLRGISETGTTLRGLVERCAPDAVVFLYNPESFDNTMFNLK